MTSSKPAEASTDPNRGARTLFSIVGGLLVVVALYLLAFGGGADQHAGDSTAQADADQRRSDVVDTATQTKMPDQDTATRVRVASALPAPAESVMSGQNVTAARTPQLTEQNAPPPAAPRPATATIIVSSEIIQQRLQTLFGEDGHIEPVRVDGMRIRVYGRSPSNARVSQFLRALVDRDAAMAPELVSVMQRDGAIHFEIMLRPGTLSAP